MNLKNKLNELKEMCISNNVPIIRDNTEKFIINYINDNNISTVLEIGTAYGYSAFSICMNCNIKYFESIEKNINSYNIAKKFIDPLNIKHLNLIYFDAFKYTPIKKFDLIFIDGPKANQIELFEKYINFLKPNGKIIIDNLYLQKIRNIEDSKKTNSQKNLIKKLDNFVDYLKNIKNYKFELIDIDDGVGVISKYEQ